MSDPLRMHVRPALQGAPLVLAFEGWNDAGQAASTAARFVADAIRSVPLAEIDGEEFLDFTVARPNVRLDESGGGDGWSRTIEWPCTRFEYGSVDGTREIAIGIGPEPHLRWRHYCEAVATVVRELGISRVVLLGAFLADVVYSRPVGVTGFSTEPELLASLGVQSSGYQGPTGIVGVLTDRLRRDGVEIVSLWAGLPHYISVAPNPRGALALVHKLTECLAIKVDDGPLRREAAHFEQRVNDLVSSDPELNEYVRELKRREFAQ